MKYIKYAFVVVLCVFSFYMSDRLIIMVENLSPIMKEVKLKAKDELTEPVNAIIEGNTIIPGSYGKSVNERESYLKMNDFGVFNETFFVYDYIKPDVSLEDNLDKVIVGSAKKKYVSIIIEDEKFSKYLKDEDIEYTKIIKSSDEIKEESYINGNLEREEYDELNMYLKRQKINNKICLVEYSNMELCRKYKYYLISPSKKITNANLASAKNSIKGGEIILLDSSLSLNEVKILISSIKYKNLEFMKLEEFISEE